MPEGQNGLKERKILLVDDVELNQHLALHIIQSWGCVVTVADNGQIALEKINDGDFDLVLMDIQMPVMDGLEATRRIREIEDPRKSSVPIVALSANIIEGNCTQYLNAGMTDCLPKPFDEPALLKTVLKNIRINGVSNGDDAGVRLSEKQAEEPPRVISKATASYDLSMVEAISGGDRSFVVKMLRLFLETVPATLTQLQQACDKMEWLALSKVAHKLKSTVDSMGAAELKQDIRFIESSGKAGENIDQLPQVVKKVVAGMERVMADVKKDHSL